MSAGLDMLISLHKGYGLGDAVQMSSVLRHVKKYRPEWRTVYRAEEGFHQVGEGLVDHHCSYQQWGKLDRHYDAEVQLCLYEIYAGWTDRPNTRVTQVLHELLDIPWDTHLAQYSVQVRLDTRETARTVLRGPADGIKRRQSLNRHGLVGREQPLVAVHYQGDSAKQLKDLTHEQAGRVCAAVEKLGAVPVVLDWRQTCPLGVRCLRDPQQLGRDAEFVAALISECSAFVGIDSGPSKCASATDTPSLVVWTGHHPALYHDPALNTTHLVPEGYCGMLLPSSGMVSAWFEANYRVVKYKADPVPPIESWLKETLR